MADPRDYNPTLGGYGVEATGQTVEDVDDVPAGLKNEQTERSRWAHGVAGRSMIAPAMPVATRDGSEIGFVREVHDDYMRVKRHSGADLRVPYPSVADVTGNRVLLDVDADELDSMGWHRR
jgi:hypothetical protein